MKEEQEYKISFVNKGKPFKLSRWTVKKHNDILRKSAQYEKDNPDMNEEERLNKYQTYLILEGLKEIDESVKEDDIEDMHPIDRNELFAAIFNNGREGITSDAANFRKTKK
jgi:hypothetical protein